MRWVAVSAVLLAATGCNQFFGLDETAQNPDVILDAIETDTGALQLTRKRVVTNAEHASVVLDEPVRDAEVRVGPLSTALVDLPVAGLDAVTGAYVFAKPRPDAAVTQMRAVITLPGEPPLEVVWNNPDGNVAIEIPRLGRDNDPATDADDVNPASRWVVEGELMQPLGTTLLTTGSLLTMTLNASNGQVLIPWSNPTLAAIGDALVRPAAALGDLAVLLRHASHAQCSYATNASATFEAPPQVAGDSPTVTPLWSVTNARVDIAWDYLMVRDRAQAALGGFVPGGADPEGAITFGFLPSAQVPTILPVAERATAAMTRPAILPLFECPLGAVLVNSGPTYAVVDALESSFEDAVRLELRWSRGDYQSGYESVSPVVGAMGSIKTATLSRDAAFATALRVMRDGAALDVGGSDPEGQPLVGAGPITLVFEAEAGKRVDFWSVTLVRADLTVERVWLTPEPRVVLEQAPAAGEYAFVVRGHIGAPAAAAGDYRPAPLPHAATMVTARTFSIQ